MRDRINVRRRAENTARQRKRRRAKGVKPREEYEAESFSKTRPWEFFGIKRRAWERRGKPNPPKEKQNNMNQHSRAAISYRDKSHRSHLLEDGSRLWLAASDALVDCKHNVDRALPRFVKLVGSDKALIREALRFYLRILAEEQSLPGGGQTTNDSQFGFAATRQPNGDEVGPAGPAHQTGQNHVAGQSPTNRDGAGHEIRAPHIWTARPAREPSAADRAAQARVAKRIEITIFDTFKISGRSIGDWSIVAAISEGPQMAFHASVLIEARREAERTVANIESWMTFRDVLKVHQMQQVIQRAAGVADAA